MKHLMLFLILACSLRAADSLTYTQVNTRYVVLDGPVAGSITVYDLVGTVNTLAANDAKAMGYLRTWSWAGFRGIDEKGQPIYADPIAPQTYAAYIKGLADGIKLANDSVRANVLSLKSIDSVDSNQTTR